MDLKELANRGMKQFPNKEMTGMTHFSLLPSLMCLIGGTGGTGGPGGPGGPSG